jgi:hypothetical protein
MSNRVMDMYAARASTGTLHKADGTSVTMASMMGVLEEYDDGSYGFFPGNRIVRDSTGSPRRVSESCGGSVPDIVEEAVDAQREEITKLRGELEQAAKRLESSAQTIKELRADKEKLVDRLMILAERSLGIEVQPSRSRGNSNGVHSV